MRFKHSKRFQLESLDFLQVDKITIIAKTFMEQTSEYN